MDSTESSKLPLFSPVNLLIAAIVMVGFVIIFLASGNQIFNPGDLSSGSSSIAAVSDYSSHAEFEDQCQLCHQPLGSAQADLCIECHTGVGRQIEREIGLHGIMENVNECRQCHRDHQGSDFDMLASARDSFDHSTTAFMLDERHAGAACQECHQPDTALATSNCEGCHEEPEIHAGIFPADCGMCHQANTWQTVTWQDQPYSHDLVGFSLISHQSDFDGSPLICQDCHTGAVDFEAAFVCQECHSGQDPQFMQEHVLAFGQSCTECHDGVDRMEQFDHAAVFPLEGKHLELTCAACHTGQAFNESQTVCASCHQEPEIHAGFFGLRCQMCHTADDWQPARLGLHNFPLDHGSGEISSCITCHADAYTGYTCYTCHDHREDQMMEVHVKAGIAEDQIADCAACHLDGLVHETP